MPLYWSKRSIPELRELPAARRRLVWRQAWRDVHDEPVVRRGRRLVGLCAGAGAPMGIWLSGGIGPEEALGVAFASPPPSPCETVGSNSS